jgi:hypothetical protein
MVSDRAWWCCDDRMQTVNRSSSVQSCRRVSKSKMRNDVSKIMTVRAGFADQRQVFLLGQGQNGLTTIGSRVVGESMEGGCPGGLGVYCHRQCTPRCLSRAGLRRLAWQEDPCESWRGVVSGRKNVD